VLRRRDPHRSGTVSAAEFAAAVGEPSLAGAATGHTAAYRAAALRLAQ